MSARPGRWSRRRSRTLVVVVLLVVGSVQHAWGAAAAAPSTGHAERWLVTLADPVDGATFARQLGATPVGVPARSRVQVVEAPGDGASAALERRLAAHPSVRAVERDAEVRLAESHDDDQDEGPEADPALRHLDPAWWHLRNLGQSVDGRSGRVAIDLGVDTAWPHADGAGVVIALIDTGVDVEHPHLRDQLWVNPHPGPDVHGWNFVEDDDQLFHDATRDRHGTHLAGILVGAVDDDLGVAGIAPGAKVMVLRFLNGTVGQLSDAVKAIQYAADNGADVINASWTTSQPAVALRAALIEAGLPVVVAAGNSGRSLDTQPLYPASWRLPNVLSVTAVDHRGALATFGATSAESVDVAAPGVAIRSTVPEGGFGTESGTSQAAPMVTGALALALQHRPELTPVELLEEVRRAVRPLSALEDTRSAGIVRSSSLLDAVGVRVPVCDGTVPTASFTDVAPGSAHERGIDCLVGTGVARGRTADTFGVDGLLTRAQVATMLANVLDRAGALPDPPAEGRFDDVPDDLVHRDNIETLAELGLVAGRSSTRYDPGAPTTRAELAALTIRLLEHLADGPARAGTGVGFSDTEGHTHQRRIDHAATFRTVRGLPDGSFAPDRHVRRDQAASMVNALLDRLLQLGLSS
jgi:subtilisin family serine protease